jgi:hypothetical protein
MDYVDASVKLFGPTNIVSQRATACARPKAPVPLSWGRLSVPVRNSEVRFRKSELAVLTVSRCLIACALFDEQCLDCAQEIEGDDMTSTADTALTLVVVKSVAIVGSAVAAVVLLALFGAKTR